MANDAIDYINRDIVNVKKELEILSRLVRDGNGQPSLLSQVAKLNSDLTRLEIEIKNELNDIREKNTQSWQIKTAIIVALITSLTSIFIHFTSQQRDKSIQVLEELSQKLDEHDPLLMQHLQADKALQKTVNTPAKK